MSARTSPGGPPRILEKTDQMNRPTTLQIVHAGGWGTKFHLLTCGNGVPLAATLAGGQVHESKQIEPLVGWLVWWRYLSSVLRTARRVDPSDRPQFTE
jgi:hypothetical protein